MRFYEVPRGIEQQHYRAVQSDRDVYLKLHCNRKGKHQLPVWSEVFIQNIPITKYSTSCASTRQRIDLRTFLRLKLEKNFAQDSLVEILPSSLSTSQTTKKRINRQVGV